MILVFAGRPGSGKTTLVKELLQANPEWSYVQAVTTRQKRESDLAGQYEHLSEKEFEERNARGELILPVKVHGYQSAIKKSSVEELIQSKVNGVIVFVPSFVEGFIDIAKQSLPFYIFGGDDTQLQNRLNKRDGDITSINNKLEETKYWDEEARKSKIPYIFIDNSGSIEHSLGQIRKSYMK